MARVHCPDCEMAVIVDPNGVCPEGHLIGNVGRRIELAIGDHTPHPDEPEPWSAMIEAAADAIEADAEPAAPRAIRPISIVGESEDLEVEEQNEDLMRELHALSDLDTRTEERAATGPSRPAMPFDGHAAEEDEPEVYRAPVAEAPAEAAETPATSSERPHRSEEDLEAIAELAALFDGGTGGSSAPPAATRAAARHSTDEAEGTGGGTGATEGGTGATEGGTGATEGEADTVEGTEAHLASVSHLPYDTAQQGGGAPSTPERDTSRASGEAFDWSHFTAKGKRRRFGR